MDKSSISVSQYPGVILLRGFCAAEKATLDGVDSGVMSLSCCGGEDSSAKSRMSGELEEVIVVGD